MAMSEAKRMKIAQQRKEQILSVALRLFYKNGYSNTKVSDIAEAADISKGLVYRYFNNKAAILFAYLDDMNRCLDEVRAMPTAKGAIERFGTQLLSDPDETGYLPPLRVYITVFIKGELNDQKYENPVYQDFGTAFFGPLFEKGIRAGEFKAGDANVFANIYWHYLLGVMMDMIQNDDNSIPVPHLDGVISLFTA